MKLNLHINNQTEKKIDQDWFRNIVREFLLRESFDEVELGIHLVSATEIKKINREHRSKNQPTDIISFPIDRPLEKKIDHELIILGDLFISPEIVQRQAKSGYQQEMTKVVRHGLTHLLGLDHQNTAEKNKFNQYQKL